jgi:hypothetical protein
VAGAAFFLHFRRRHAPERRDQCPEKKSRKNRGAHDHSRAATARTTHRRIAYSPEEFPRRALIHVFTLQKAAFLDIFVTNATISVGPV